jgi:hypothetical protein
VGRRSKPADYVYTETEVKDYDALEERIAALEENGTGGTAVDLSNYYTKAEADEVIEDKIDYYCHDFVTTETLEDALSNIDIDTSVSWNDITDKPFSDGFSFETTVDMAHGAAHITEPIVGVEADRDYIVNLNGDEYECVSYETELGMVIESKYAVGNGSGDFGLLSFLVVTVYSEPVIENGVLYYGCIEYPADLSGIFTLNIYSTDGAKTLDSKYIPTASETEKGAVIVGSGLSITDGVLSVSEEYIKAYIDTALGVIENGSY